MSDGIAVKSSPLVSRRLEPADAAPRAPETPAPSATERRNGRRTAAVSAPLPPAQRAAYAEAKAAATAGATFDLWAKANEGKQVGATQEIFRLSSVGGQAVRAAKTAMLEAGRDLNNDAASYLLKAVQGAFKELQPSVGPNGAVLIRAMVKNERSEGPQAYRAVTLVVGRSGEVVSASAVAPSAKPIEGIPVPPQDAKGERHRVALEASVVPMIAARSMALPEPSSRDDRLSPSGLMSKPANVGAAQTRAETQKRARLEAELAAGVTTYQRQLAFAKPLMRAYSTIELNTRWADDKTQLTTAEQAFDKAMKPLKAAELNLGELLLRLAPAGTKRERFIDSHNNLNPGIASRLVDPGDRAAYLKSLK